MAWEFLSAFARFFIDREEFDRTLGALERESVQAAKSIERTLDAIKRRPLMPAKDLEAFRRGAAIEVTCAVRQAVQGGASGAERIQLEQHLTWLVDEICQARRAQTIGMGRLLEEATLR